MRPARPFPSSRLLPSCTYSKDVRRLLPICGQQGCMVKEAMFVRTNLMIFVRFEHIQGLRIEALVNRQDFSLGASEKNKCSHPITADTICEGNATFKQKHRCSRHRTKFICFNIFKTRNPPPPPRRQHNLASGQTLDNPTSEEERLTMACVASLATQSTFAPSPPCCSRRATAAQFSGDTCFCRLGPPSFGTLVSYHSKSLLDRS